MEQVGISPNESKKTSQILELLWPNVPDLVTAERWAEYGMSASFAVATITAVFVLFNRAPRAALIEAVPFIAIGFGIRKMSRIAAVAGLVFYIIDQVIVAMQGRIGDGLYAVIFIGMFLRGIRGTFAYREFRANEKATEAS